MGGTTLKKDIGVKLSTDMNISEQCGIAASNGNKILDWEKYNIQGKQDNYTSVYRTVRLHLEYSLYKFGDHIVRRIYA